jgi:serine/threonine protein kinase
MAIDAARAKSLFLAASDLADPAERAAYLDRECGGDAELRERVEALLRADADGDPGQTENYVAAEPEPGAVIASRYTLVEKIGEGGMGEVWVAKQTEPVKRKVALKLIKAGMDTKAVLQRFEAERQALAMMDHPNIARVLDGGVVGQDSNPDQARADRIGILSHVGRPFFVMELVNGLPLTKFCDDAKLGIRERLELFASICQAVQHAHQKGIIHRDLKPSNILVTLIDARPVPKVIDFGVAKAIGGKLLDESLSTQFGAVVGTLEYMSPEQAGFSGIDIDTRADIYSLGVILYELLTGLRPIDAKRLKKAAHTEMIRIIQEEEPPKPSTRLSQSGDSLPAIAAQRHTEPAKLSKLVRGDLDWITMKCLEKDRTRRYETANGLARDIQRYLSDEPVEAGPPSVTYRLRKFVRRNKATIGAATLVLLALVSGIAGTTWGMVEAWRQWDLADAARTDERAARIREGERADAEAKERRRAEAAEKQAVQETLATLTVMEDLAGALSKQGTSRYPKAEALYDRVLEGYTRHYGAAHPRTLKVMESTAALCVAYADKEKNPKAEQLLKSLVEMRRRAHGDLHAQTIDAESSLARLYRGWKPEQAGALFDAVWKKRQLILGAEHPDTLKALFELAESYAMQRRVVEAERLYTQALSIQRQTPRHGQTLDLLNKLARFYEENNKWQEAEELHREYFELARQAYGEDHTVTHNAAYSLALFYSQQEKHALAEPWWEKELAVIAREYGEDHVMVWRNLSCLAKCYGAQEKHSKAEEIFQRLLRSQRNIRTHDSGEVIETTLALAKCQLAQRKYAATESTLLQAYAGLKRQREPMRRESMQFKQVFFQRLVELYDAWGKPDEAAKWRKELEAAKP